MSSQMQKRDDRSLAPDRYEPQSLEQLQWLSEQVVRSGLAPSGVDSTEDAMVILMTGAELGMTAMQSLRGIHVIKGRPTLSADLQVALVRESDHCEYFQMTECSDTRVSYETKRRGAPAPTTWTYTKQDAQRADLWGQDGPWSKYPKHMLRARCASSLARAEYPEVVMGLYTPEEAASIDGDDLDDDVLEAEFQAAGDIEPQEGPMTGVQGKAEAYTDRIRDRLDEVDAGFESYMEALAAWACDTYEVEHWRWLSLDQLEEIGKWIAGHPQAGGRLSPRRRTLDETVAAYDDEVTVDWSITGGEADAWDTVNKRWRVLVNETVDGDDTARDYHEVLKARHEVSSFNDLTMGQIMDDIIALERRSDETDDPAAISERLEYILSEIDEHVPSSEEMGLESADDESDGSGDSGGRWELDETPTWARDRKRRQMRGETDLESSDGPYYDLDGLRDHDEPAGEIVRWVDGSTSASTLTRLLRLIVELADAETLEGVPGPALSEWVATAQASDDVLGWVRRCLDAGALASADPPNIQTLRDRGDDLGQFCKHLTLAVDDSEVEQALDVVCEREEVDRAIDLTRCDLSDWIEWADQSPGTLQHAVRRLIGDGGEEPAPTTDWSADDLEGVHETLYRVVDGAVDSATRDRFLEGPCCAGMQADSFPELPDDHIEMWSGKLRESEGREKYIRQKLEKYD